MSRFENKLCPVCRSPFTEKADIIVCPECGTPHHRTCYLVLKHCALEERHAEGFVWRGALPDETTGEPELPQADPHHASYPEGTPQNISPFDSGEDYGQSAEEFLQNYRHTLENDEQGEDGVSMRELMTYAARSEIHYGMAFEVFRNKIGGKRRVVFVNICSGIFAPIFQFYRKMDLLGVGALVLMILTSLPGIMDYSGLIDWTQNESNIYLFYMLGNILSFAQTVVLCLFGDYLYYRHAVKRIKKIRGGFGDKRGEEYFEALRESGRPSWLRAIIGLLLTAFVTACVTVLIMRG